MLDSYLFIFSSILLQSRPPLITHPHHQRKKTTSLVTTIPLPQRHLCIPPRAPDLIRATPTLLAGILVPTITVTFSKQHPNSRKHQLPLLHQLHLAEARVIENLRV